jgi:cytochrome o ubiquinol oxidase operon protein cyoD
MTQEDKGHSPTGHLSFGKYFLGFILAILLTLVSFAIVVADVQPKYFAVIALVLAAVVQIIVHLYYFLHLDRSPEMRWNFIAIAFTALILLIFVGGTVWVMYSLNSRMGMGTM